MASALVLLSLTALVAAVAYWHHRSEPRMRSPLWGAFSVTALVIMLLVTGSVGHRLDRRARFFAGASEADGVIWSQVGIGVALMPLAAYLWRRGLRDLDRRTRIRR